MSPSYWLIRICLFLFAGLFIGAAAVQSSASRWAMVCGGAAGLCVIYFWSRRDAAWAKAEKQRRDSARLEELKREFALIGNPLAVRGSTGLSLSILVVLFATGGVYLALTQTALETIVLACVLVPIAFVLTLATIPLLGKPVIVIQRDGVHSPAYGLITWKDIHGIALHEIRSKGATVAHMLHFYVPELATRTDQMHRVTQLLYALRTRRQRSRIVVRLSSTSESPSVIQQLCSHLWTAATGRTFRWSPLLSEEDMRLIARGEEQLKSLEAAGELALKDPAAAMKVLHEFEQRYPELKRSQDTDVGVPSREALLAELRRKRPSAEEMRERAREIAREKMKTHPVTWVITIALVLGVIWFIASESVK